MGLTDTLTGLMKSRGVPDKYISSVTKMMEDGSLSLVDKVSPEGELPSDDAVRSELSRP